MVRGLQSSHIMKSRNTSLRFLSHLNAVITVIGVTAYTVIPREAQAEGATELGTTQALQNTTIAYVDIDDPSVQRIKWTGTGSLSVKDPTGKVVGTITSGQSIAATPNISGAYMLTFSTNQTTSVAWDITVTNASKPAGRLFSYQWKFNAGSYAASASTSASFYALIPTGTQNDTGVIELKLDQLAGYIYELSANRIGVNGGTGRSVTITGNSVSPEFPIYLNPPLKASYTSTLPDITAFNFNGGSDVSVFGQSMSCDMIASGSTTGKFAFSTNTIGTYHLICDIDKDGVFSRASQKDVVLVGAAEPGTNRLTWDGLDKSGDIVPIGTYNCIVELHAGEFHYVGRDIETSYPGLRIYQVDASAARTPLRMHWDDTLVQSTKVLMPNNTYGLATSPSEGMWPDIYSAVAVPNINARAWGNFSATSQGNDNFLDTFVWLSNNASTQISVKSVDAVKDTDFDGLPDVTESCTYGSDPMNADTDGDGVPDGQQYAGIQTTSASDGGLESNGHLATALALRSVFKSRMAAAVFGHGMGLSDATSTFKGKIHVFGDPIMDDTQPTKSAERIEILSWLPASIKQWSGKELVARDVTPSDLTLVTNASEIAAKDYIDQENNVVASALIIQAVGDLYEHTKAVCDRAHGAQLVDVSTQSVSGQSMVAFSMQHPETKTLDHSLTFVVYEVRDDDGIRYEVNSEWLMANYPQVSEATVTYQVQLWARNPHDLKELSSALISTLNTRAEVSSSIKSARVPDTYMSTASTLGGKIDLGLVSLSDHDYQIRATLIDEFGLPQVVDMPHNTNAKQSTLSQQLPLFLDATVDVIVGDHVVDKVWLSDGTWIPLGDSIGYTMSVQGFDSYQCATGQADFQSAMASLHLNNQPISRLSGCGKVAEDASGVTGVARNLSSQKWTLSPNDTIVFEAQSQTSIRFCVESSVSKSFGCVDIPSADEGKWYTVAGRDLVHAGFESESPVSLLSWSPIDPNKRSLRVSGLARIEGDVENAAATLPRASGCQLRAYEASQSSSPSTWLFVWTAAIVYRFAKRIRARKPINRSTHRDDDGD